MRSTLKFIYPKIGFSNLLFIVQFTILGALTAGVYGILHDQITYSLSAEYFTQFKFIQFDQVRPNIGGNRLFASVIGFMATWWVGAICGWVLSRLSILKDQSRLPTSFIWKQFLHLLGITAVIGLGGYLYGVFISNPQALFWQSFKSEFQVEDIESFTRVGCIHNSSYLGGTIGTIIAIINVLRAKAWLTD